MSCSSVCEVNPTSSEKLGLFLTAVSMTFSLVVGCFCATRIYDEATQHVACQQSSRRRRQSSITAEDLKKLLIPDAWYAFKSDPANSVRMWFRKVTSKMATTADYLDQVSGFLSDPDCSQQRAPECEPVVCAPVVCAPVRSECSN